MKYVISPFLVTTDPDSMVIKNTRSDQRMAISEETKELLSCFSEPRTFEDVLSEVASTKKARESILLFLEQLVKEEILLPEGALEEKGSSGALADKALVEVPTRTFFNCPKKDIRALKDENIVFLGIPFDLGTTGYPGTRFGPDKMRELSSLTFEYHADVITGKSKGWFYAEKNKMVLAGKKIVDVGNILLQIGEEFERFYDRVSRVVSMVVTKNRFLIAVGGDHSCSYPILRAMKDRYGEISVIHIDAHTDLGDLVDGVANNHGNVFTKVRREKLATHLYQFGIRGCIGKKIVAPDYSFFPLTELKRIGIEKALCALDPTRKYYLSLDIDVLDPAFAPGTGTPSAFGMTPEMLFEFLSIVTRKVEIVGCDIVEVNPMLDQYDQTSEIALSMLFHFLSEVFK